MSRESPIVLIADDNADIRAVLGILLRGAGYDTVTANNGEQAVSLAAQTRPDLVLLDIAMPKMDGLAAARQIRRIAGLEKVPIVGCSAYEPEAEDLAPHREALLDFFLSKPADFGELLSVVASLIASSAQR
jgi:CheY-like chemotaxis protein